MITVKPALQQEVNCYSLPCASQEHSQSAIEAHAKAVETLKVPYCQSVMELA